MAVVLHQCIRIFFNLKCLTDAKYLSVADVLCWIPHWCFPVTLSTYRVSFERKVLDDVYYILYNSGNYNSQFYHPHILITVIDSFRCCDSSSMFQIKLIISYGFQSVMFHVLLWLFVVNYSLIYIFSEFQ